MPISFVRAAIVLGLLSTVGPIAIDMYLPALPAMTTDLAATSAGTQLSLMAYFVAVAAFQPLYGPVSDMIGRRRPLFFGLLLYVAAGVGAAFAPSIDVLVALRFVQGVGGCACMVIPRAVVRDLYTGVMAARLMALILLVFGVGPILAPFFGSLIAEALGWRAIFAVMSVIGVAALILLTVALPETRTADKRLSSNVKTAMAGYAELVRDPHFLGVSLVGGCALSGFFAFIAGSSFVYIGHYGVSPTTSSMLFSVNAIGFFSVAQLNGRLDAAIGLRRMVRAAASFFWLISVALLAYFMAGGDSIQVLVVGLFLAFASLGLIIPAATVLALENYGPTAGTASSLLGTIQFGSGAVAVALVSAGTQGSIVHMVGTIAVFATIAMVTSMTVLRGGQCLPAE